MVISAMFRELTANLGWESTTKQFMFLVSIKHIQLSENCSVLYILKTVRLKWLFCNKTQFAAVVQEKCIVGKVELRKMGYGRGFAASHSGGKTWQRLSPVLPGAQQWESVGNSSMRKGNAAISISPLADLLEPGSEHPAWLLT